ncbi:MAG: hypothetical protein M8357_16260 [Desulfobulbaceae bacterium]|nr:hypothetical protein [Desulfobulbaceae bacterium]
MSNIIKKIEDAMMAAAFAEAGEHEYARGLLTAGKNSHKKVLLSTDCPVVTGKVLDHAFNLCKRLGSALEVYQIIPMDMSATSPQEFFEKGTRRLQSLQEKMKQLGISYKYSIKEASLQDELTVVASKRRDIMAVIIPVCDGVREQEDEFKSSISGLFRCPVIFFES